MEDARLLWVEEPVRPTDLAGYRLASSHIKTAIAGGEAIFNPAGFLPFLADGSMDVLQPDIAICGGLTGVSQVATLAAMHLRPVIPHVWGSTVNFHAALHLIATLPPHRAGGKDPYPYIEFDVGPNPLLDLAGRPQLDGNGMVSIPDRPGLGIDIRPADLEAYTTEQRTIRA
jgi:D-galactarolactone cycloisomerase